MKKIVIVVLVILTSVACDHQKRQIRNLAENEKLVKRYFEHFNNHEWEKMANMYIEVSEFKDPSLGKAIVKQNRKEIIEKYTELNQIFPDLHDRVIDIYPLGENDIIVEFISSGTAPDNSKFG